MWIPTICILRLVETEKVSVVEIGEVEVAVSRPARPACALVHFKREVSALQVFHWSLVARLLLRRGYPGLT